MTEDSNDLFRPLANLEYRTPLEVFDMMCDRFRRAAAVNAMSGEVSGDDITRATEAYESVYEGSLDIGAIFWTDNKPVAMRAALEAFLAGRATPRPASELVAALRGMLNHSCVADSAAEDKDAEDHDAERAARAAIRKFEALDAALAQPSGVAASLPTAGVGVPEGNELFNRAMTAVRDFDEWAACNETMAEACSEWPIPHDEFMAVKARQSLKALSELKAWFPALTGRTALKEGQG